jgi:hypothetical protein
MTNTVVSWVVQDLRLFLTAVVVGGVTGATAQSLLGVWADPQTATDITLALGTTITGAAHARLAHREPLGPLAIGVLIGLPTVYIAMRALHLVLSGIR